MRFICVSAVLALAILGGGCLSNDMTKDLPMNPLNDQKGRLAFTCMHESIPEPSVESDSLFLYARWLQKNNQLKEDPDVDLETSRLYRIAAEHDHYKASINLQNGGMRGQFELEGHEYLRLSQRLIDAGVATGYYFVGIFLKQGAAGLQQDEKMSLRFFRKAADMGSSNAQYYVGEKLEPGNIAPAVALDMYKCAALQGHGKAAVIKALYSRSQQTYTEAIEFLQQGVAAGDESAAGYLDDAFRNPPPSDELNYFAQAEDLERAKRYEKIWRILANYSYANPKVPEINEIVPLPPAPLPEWDGKLQWLEERLANVPPPKPDEALITRLAKEKGLDPKTGKPLPGSPAFSQANFPVMIRYSGEVCPESGHWKVIWPPGRNVLYRQVTRHFEQGQVFPSQRVDRFHLRPWPFSDKRSSSDEPVEWGLLG